VGGITDAEQARPVPARETVDLDGEQFDLVPVRQIVHSVREERDEMGDRGAKGG